MLTSHPEGARGRLLSVEVDPQVAAAYGAAGQYCRVAVEGDDEGGYFAVASPPRGTTALEFYVQPAGGASDRLAAAAPGVALRVGMPMGDGYGLDAALAEGGPLVVLAAGSGLSGVRAALHQIHTAGRTVDLLVGVRTTADLIFSRDLERFRDQGSRVEVVESRPPTGAGRHVQHVLAARAPDLRGAWVLACGPDGLLSEGRQACAALGLPPERFRINF